MHVGLRKTLMASLLAAFAVQTTLVYTDDTADRTPPLSEQALEGRRLWHRHNCQVCHQIYGFGGFLGPDLTNAGRRMTTDYLTKVLTEGPQEGRTQMPAFHMNSEQIAALEAYFKELDQTGIGVARAYRPPEPGVVFATIRAHAQSAPVAVQQGLGTFQAVCAACHTPFCATPLGPHTAPDLSTACERLSDRELMTTIAAGRIDRGMPAWPLGETVVDQQLVPFLKWLHAERETLTGKLGGRGQAQGLPWWEFQ